jgi:DNA invertase Pin-like site-specific DNA recombinase
LIAALAEFEREIIQERVRSGLARVKETGHTRSGKPVGRPRRPVNLEAIARLRAAGKTWREIAQALKTPRRTLERAHLSALGQNPPPKSASKSQRAAQLSAGSART